MVLVAYLAQVHTTIIHTQVCKAMWQYKKGTTRGVLLTKRYAIKVPLLFTNTRKDKASIFIQGWFSNRIEYKIGKFLSKERFAPVLLSLFGSLVIVMPRCETLFEKEFNSNLSLIEGIKADLKYAYPYYDTTNGGYNDIYNYGRLNGNIVLLDYGLSMRYI